MPDRRAVARLFTIACLGLCAATAAHERAFGQTPFKTVNVYIGSGPGGGYDTYGRLVARHIGPHLPGAPSATPQNMPGAGSVTLANYMTASAPADGSALAIAASSLPLVEHVAKYGAKFQSAKFQWIGRVGTMTNVTFVSRRAPAQTLDDARRHQLLIAAISANSPLTLQPQTLAQNAGLKFKIVLGYADTASALLAVDRGEADGTTVSWNILKTQKADWLTGGAIRILVQYAQTRHPDLPDTPTALELATTPEARKAILRYSGSDIGYAIFAPPATPAERVEALRRGFADMLKDADFLVDVQKLSLDLNPMEGAPLQSVVAQASAAAAAE